LTVDGRDGYIPNSWKNSWGDTAEINADNMTNNYNVLKYTCYGKEL